MSELVTGEAVVLGLRPAKLASRAVAVAIDLVVWWGTYLVLSLTLMNATASLDDAASAAVAVATLALVLVGLPVAVETLSQGRSLGKVVCGLRVVRDDGGPIRFRHALVRGAMGAVEIQLSLGVIACTASLVSARGRRLGDVFAGTLVVRERIPTPTQKPEQSPPQLGLAGRLAGMDLSGMPDELWLAVRQYLARAKQLDPQVASAMAERLAEDVTRRTGRAVPPGTPPAAFLAAVVAERQSREAQRVLGSGVGGDGAGNGPLSTGGVGRFAGVGHPTGAEPRSATGGPSKGWALPGGKPPAQDPAIGGAEADTDQRGASPAIGQPGASEAEGLTESGFAPPG